MDYWCHRIFKQEPEISVPLIERGILTIGYNEVPGINPDITEDVRSGKVDFQGLADILEQCYKWTGNSLGQKTGVLWNFLHEFKVGDFVVVPGENSRSYGIFEISEQAEIIDKLPPKKLAYLNVNLIQGKGLERNGKFFDLGFFIKVRAVTDYDSSPFIPCEKNFLYNVLKNVLQTNRSLNKL